VFADVAKLTVGDGALTGRVVGSEGAQAAAAPAPQPSVSPTEIDNGDAAGAPDAGPGSLASTGAELGAMALLGAMLVALGEATRRRFRRHAA
jgi:hypothetical protein